MPPKTTPLVLSTLTVPEGVHASLLRYQREHGFATLSDAIRELLNGYDPITFARRKSSRQMTCRLPVRTRTMLLRTARANNSTLNTVVVTALRQLLGDAEAGTTAAATPPPPTRRTLPPRPPAREKPPAPVSRPKPNPKNNHRAASTAPFAANAAATPAGRVFQKVAPARPKPPPKTKPAPRRAR